MQREISWIEVYRACQLSSPRFWAQTVAQPSMIPGVVGDVHEQRPADRFISRAGCSDCRVMFGVRYFILIATPLFP